MNRYVTVALMVTALASVVRAQDALNGSWQGETRSGASIVLTLAVKGTVLTGTLLRGEERIALSDGKATRTTCTFKATLNDQAEGFSGELAGDELKVWMDRQGPATAIVLRRVKGK